MAIVVFPDIIGYICYTEAAFSFYVAFLIYHRKEIILKNNVMGKLAVVALGGNALLRSGQRGTYSEQLDNVRETCDSLAGLVSREYDIVVGHGNGPQVGNVLLQHEGGRKMFDIEPMPMDYCVAETQGSIGYMIERTLRNVFAEKDMRKGVVSLITEVVVNHDDPAFLNPTKPIGPYYQKSHADAFAAKDGSVFKEDPKGYGWRKVVASPMPQKIMNVDLIQQLAEAGNVVIASGGGGIPVYYENGVLHGVEAVIDKDLACAVMAAELKADKFFIITDVPKVYINFRKPGEQALGKITVAEAEQYIAEGHFAEGSMLPKIRAALHYVKNGGKECVITDAANLWVKKSGTRIVP